MEIESVYWMDEFAVDLSETWKESNRVAWMAANAVDRMATR